MSLCLNVFTVPKFRQGATGEGHVRVSVCARVCASVYMIFGIRLALVSDGEISNVSGGYLWVIE